MKLDFFKHKSAEDRAPEAPKVASIEKKPDQSEIIKVQEKVLSDFLDQTADIEINELMAKNEIEGVAGSSIETRLEKEIRDSELKGIHDETAMAVERVAENKTILEKFRGYSRAAIITAMLSLGINSAFSANEKSKDRTEQGSKKEKEPIFVLSATNFFETDKADLNNPAELVQKFDEFLSKVNEQNFQEVLDQDWKAEGSSDERKTFNWDGKNVNLTKARNQAYINLLEETLKKHNFSSQLSEDHAKQLVNKQIFSIYPTSGAEEGVTYLTDLENEEGKKYTQDEIASLKPEELQKLYEKCRYTKFVAEIKSAKPEIADLSKMKSGNIELKINPSGKIELPEIVNYDECYILIDSSPSMEYSRQSLAKELRKINIMKPVTIRYFSEGLTGKMSYFKNGNDAADMLEKMPTGGNGIENALSSTIQALDEIHKGDQEKIKAGKKIPTRVVYFLTDEGLQDPYRLSELMAKEGHDKVIGFVGSEKTAKFDLNGLENVIKKNIENSVKSRIEYIESKMAAVLAATEAREKMAVDNFLSGLISEDKKEVLAADGITGNKEEIKKRLLIKSSEDLKNIAGSDKYKYFVAEKRKLEESKNVMLKKADTDQVAINSLRKKLSESAIAQAMSDKNLKVTNFADDSGQRVEVPIN